MLQRIMRWRRERRWRKAVANEVKRMIAARLTCDHSGYRGMTVDGRCCPICGTFMADFGD